MPETLSKGGKRDTMIHKELSKFQDLKFIYWVWIFCIFFSLLSRQHNIACWEGRISALNTIACTLFGLSQYEKCVKFDNWQIRSRLRFHLKCEWSSSSIGAILCHCWKLKDVIRQYWFSVCSSLQHFQNNLRQRSSVKFYDGQEVAKDSGSSQESERKK